MPASFDHLPELGVGMVYWPELETLLEEKSSLINVIEIEPQALWYETDHVELPYFPDPAILQRLRSLPQPKLIHSVGLPIGGSRSPIMSHLPLLQEFVGDLNAVWASEHLSFNHASISGRLSPTGFLLPPLQTHEGVTTAVHAIRQISTQLPISFAIETGVSYLKPRPGELSDGQFVASIVTEADCGILLDLHNVWTNERNGRQSVYEFLSEIPLDRVLEIHLAGGCEYEGYWLDAHSGMVPEPLMALAATVIPHLPNLRAIIFEILPIFIPRLGLAQVRTQLEQLHKLWGLRQSCSTSLNRATAQQVQNLVDRKDTARVTTEVWEDTLAAIVNGQTCEGPLCADLKADSGSSILQILVESVRSGMVVDGLKLTSRLIMLQRGEALFRQLLSDFWRNSPPHMFASAEALGFADYLAACQLGIPYLAEILSFETAQLHEARTGEARTVNFPFDPVPLLQALCKGQLPDFLPVGNFEIEVSSYLGAQIREAAIRLK